MTHPKLKDSATDYTDDCTEKAHHGDHPGLIGEAGRVNSV
jgi:hypothetical protein